jgi:energy-converting hydrogenase Eha subunit G
VAGIVVAMVVIAVDLQDFQEVIVTTLGYLAMLVMVEAFGVLMIAVLLLPGFAP